jgi:hypothetical protein
MKIKSLSILLSIIFVISSCSTNPNATKKRVSKNDVSHLIPILWPGLETDMKLIIPVKMQDENGLFIWVDKESEFYNEKWNRGYAGMFPVGYNGTEIGGFKISLPMQITGNWSSDYEDYFTRNKDDDLDSFYHNWSEQHLYTTKTFIPQNKYSKVSPYDEFDKAYSKMITNNNDLSLEQKFELIIVNHKGYMTHLYSNLMELIEIYFDENSKTQDLDETDFNIRVKKDPLSLDPKEHYNTFSDFYTDLDKYYIVEGFLNFAINPKFQNKDLIEQFFFRIIASYKILQYRLPEIYEIFIPDIHDFSYYITGENVGWGGTAQYIKPNSRITIGEKTLEYEYEKFLGTIFHEKIHYIIQSNVYELISVDEELHQWLNNPSYNSEIITYGNTTLLAEVLNFSPITIRNSANTPWWGYGDMYYDGVAPLDKFIQIIDNQNGVAKP